MEEEKKKTPKWVIVLIVVVGFITIIGVLGESESDKISKESNNDNSKVQENITEEKETVSTEYKNALKKAESYSKMMFMSKQGIYDQLTSEYGEQFPTDAAQYAIENISADWNANALAKAKQYQETMSMSKQAIYDQLISEYGEKFTPEEAQYAVDHLN